MEEQARSRSGLLEVLVFAARIAVAAGTIKVSSFGIATLAEVADTCCSFDFTKQVAARIAIGAADTAVSITAVAGPVAAVDTSCNLIVTNK